MVIDGWAEVPSGVPQGSILGPLLFLVYANVISDGLSTNCRLFADDCTLFGEVNSRSEALILQRDLDLVVTWSRTWQLPLNTSKCKVICISNQKSPFQFRYTINNSEVQWVDNFKYLGVTVDGKLKWDKHINQSAGKASRILNVLRRNLCNCSKHSRKIGYQSLVLPHLQFCAPVWSPHQKNHLNRTHFHSAEHCIRYC